MLLKAAARFGCEATTFSTAECLENDEIPPNLVELLAVLAEQPEWRVLVDGTRNFGHQASTVALMRRLIELAGFDGHVVIVYIDHERELLGRTANKLALMFEGVDPARIDDATVSYGTCRNIRFLPFARRSELHDVAAFGFTGGADDMAINFARELKVRFFARVQPFLWDDLPSARDQSYYECSRIEQPDGRHLYLLEAYPKLQDLAFKLPATPNDIGEAIWRWYAEEQIFDKDLACRTRNVRAVLTARLGEFVEPAHVPWLWPIYGLQHFKDQAAEMLLTCALVASRCVRDTRQPILLCSFSPHQELDDWSALVDALAADLMAFETRLPLLSGALLVRQACSAAEDEFSQDQLLAWTQALRAYACDDGEAVPVQVHHAYDARTGRWADISSGLKETIRDCASPSVHVIELGPVPMEIFHHCLMHANLPPVIEGQMAANFLTCIGKPFLQVLREEHVIKNGYVRPSGVKSANVTAETAAVVAQSIRDLVPQRWFIAHSTEDVDSYGIGIEQITQFVLDAKDPSTVTAAYFENVGRHFASNRNDKLLVALLGLREVILAGVDFH